MHVSNRLIKSICGFGPLISHEFECAYSFFICVYGSVSEKQNRETRKESKKKRCVLFKPELVKDNGEEWSLMQTRL